MSPVAEQLSLTDIPAAPAIPPLRIRGDLWRGADREARQGPENQRTLTCASGSPGRWPRVEAEKDQAQSEAKFLWAQENFFVPAAGRINSAAGTDLQATPDQLHRAAGGDSIIRPPTANPVSGNALAQAAEYLRRAAASVTTFPIRPQAPMSGHPVPRLRPRLVYMRVFDRPVRPSSSPAPAVAPRLACCAATIRHREGFHPRQGPRRSDPISISPSASPTPSCRRSIATAASNCCTGPNPIPT